MHKILFASFTLLAIGTACQDKSGETGDTNGGDSEDVYTGPVEIQSATWNCDAVSYWYDVYAVGWTGSATMYISQTGVSQDVRWTEFGHDFWATESFDTAPDSDTRGYYDPNGWWDNPYLELSIVSSPGDVTPGSTTLYQCDGSMENTLTWAVEVTDTAGAFADCAAWGDEVGNNEDGYNFGACRAI